MNSVTMNINVNLAKPIYLLSALLVFSVLPSLSADEWEVPQRGHVLTFPHDHGSHPTFRIEWWYLTGHLFSEEQRFGFQATFFRIGQTSSEHSEDEYFGDSQLYLAHMGITDPSGKVYLYEERLNREGWDAKAKVGDLEVVNGNWSLRREGEKLELRGSIRAEAAFSLQFTPQKSPVIFGEGGISRKGPEGTAASYYITFPRLSVEGVLEIAGQTHAVHGEAWMDHEISSSQLDRNQIGWDWASIQFHDGREIMGYVLRTDAGGISEYSILVWVDREGALKEERYPQYEWRHEGAWRSEATGAVYPISPLIVTTDPESGVSRHLRLVPLMAAQEIVGGVGGVNYWEGACDVKDENTGEIVGRAYLEMTGYASDVAGSLR